MDLPVDDAVGSLASDNPAGTEGLDFIEFSTFEPASLEELFTTLGFVEVATRPDRPISVWRQNEISFLLNADSTLHGGRFAQEHGPCVSALGFRVVNAAAAHQRAVSLGAVAYENTRGKTIDAPAVVGVGGSLLYFTDSANPALSHFVEDTASVERSREGAGLTSVDHLTHNVSAGNLEIWCEFYRRIFNFREVYYLDSRATATGFRTRAMKSPCNTICIPINEPSDPKSQIQEYIDLYHGEGVQHIALSASNIYESVEAMAESQVDFIDIPESYYAEVDGRLPGHGEDTLRLARDGILIDGDRLRGQGAWALLLQIFSKPMVGPIFFELIQRKGNEGFGDGNAKALFAAMERDQIERGVL